MSSNSFSLIVSIPGQDPTTHELSGDSASLGRGPDNDIQVLVSEVSVKHAELKVEGDTVKIVDLGSTNGTRIKGDPVGEEGVALESKSKVLLGETISAYLVSSEDLASGSADELIKSIDASEEQAGPKTEPVAPVAAAAPATPGAPAAKPVQPVKPAVLKPAAVAAPAPAAAGATTVKLDQVRPSGPGPVKPSAPKVPSPAKPGAPAAPAAPVAPAAPAPAAIPAPAGAKPGAPAAKPVAPVPLKRPGAAGGPKPVPVPKPPQKP